MNEFLFWGMMLLLTGFSYTGLHRIADALLSIRQELREIKEIGKNAGKGMSYRTCLALESIRDELQEFRRAGNSAPFEEYLGGTEVAGDVGAQVLHVGAEEISAHGADATLAEGEGALNGAGEDVLQGLVADGTVGVPMLVPAEAEGHAVTMESGKGDRP
jgi:hypothetical protein